MIRRGIFLLILFFAAFVVMTEYRGASAQTDDDIGSFLQHGQECYHRGDLKGAALEFENVLLIDRQNFSARVWLAQIFLDLKDLEKARSLLREAALQAPDHPRVIQLQKLMGEIKKPVKVDETDLVAREALSQIGSATKVRPFGLVIPGVICLFLLILKSAKKSQKKMK
jgi:tetratricopeptide (TPR) repeat protein